MSRFKISMIPCRLHFLELATKILSSLPKFLKHQSNENNTKQCISIVANVFAIFMFEKFGAFGKSVYNSVQ